MEDQMFTPQELECFFNESLQLLEDLNRKSNHDQAEDYLFTLKERLDLAISSLFSIKEELLMCDLKLELLIGNFRIYAEELQREILSLDRDIAI